MTDAVAAVKRGAKLLDTYVPGWAKKINLKTFDLGDASYCVLGQVHKDFDAALYDLADIAIKKTIAPLRNIQTASGESLAEDISNNTTASIDASYYGFDAGSNASYEALTTQWLREFAKRGVKR